MSKIFLFAAALEFIAHTRTPMRKKCDRGHEGISIIKSYRFFFYVKRGIYQTFAFQCARILQKCRHELKDRNIIVRDAEQI